VNRSRVISLLMGSSPGRFNWKREFLIQLLIYGLLQVLTLLSRNILMPSATFCFGPGTALAAKDSSNGIWPSKLGNKIMV
jgi:hypothetical protein